jgi:hypothetical protein
MESAASRLALLLDCPSVIAVRQDGEDIVVSVESGTFNSGIPTTWEGHRVKVYTEPTREEGIITKALAILLMMFLMGIVVVGIVVLLVLIAVHFN